jgi:chemotaxis protein methyltransferase CheR
MRADVEADAIEIRLFLEAIHARWGYDLRDYAQSSMARRVQTALAKSGLAHLGELQHGILHDAALFGRVIEDLTVRVTDMFRDPSVYCALRAEVIPILRTYPLLKVWHSGCASGEEVYSCAILLTEEGLYERAQIYATDVSVEAVEHAKRGIYGCDRLATFAENYAAAGGTRELTGYTTEGYDQVAFREQLRKNVLFFQHDLVGDHVFGEMNVIFCRNVLMYFGTELRERVVDKLSESLCPGGVLVLGHAEQLPPRARSAFRELAPSARIYRRLPENERR